MFSPLTLEISPGPIGDALRLPSPELLRARLLDRPVIRSPLIRLASNLQAERLFNIVTLAGEGGEKLPVLSLPDRRRVLDSAKQIVGLAARGEVACEPVGEGMYEALAALRLPAAQVIEELRSDTISAKGLKEVLNCVPFWRIREAREAHERDLESRIDDQMVRSELHRKVNAAGGIRFDHFVEAHQFGATGFYSTRLDFASELGLISVATPINMDQNYATMILKYILGYTNMFIREDVARKRDFTAQPLVFAEIGGGSGRFKCSFLDAFDESVDAGCTVPLEYVSIDINHFQRLAQTIPGTRVQAGEATSTGLPDSSVDILFSEEVPDCFPHRWFKWNHVTGKLEAEAFVISEGDSLGIEFRALSGAGELEELESHLRSTGYRLDYYRHSAMDHAFWSEAKRVLKPGGHHIIIDYTLAGVANGGRDKVGAMGMAINMPFNDITRGIDPLWMVHVAESLGFHCRHGILPRRPSQPGEERAFITGRIFEKGSS